MIEKQRLINEDDEYDINKKVSHIPLLIQTLLKDSSSSTLIFDNNKKQQLKNIHADLTELMKENRINEIPNHEIIQSSLHFLSSLLQPIPRKKINVEILTKNFIAKLRNALEENCKRATEIHLTKLNHLTQRWNEQHHLVWHTNRVLIAGPAGPRENFIDMQYWKKFYEDKGLHQPEMEWIYYVEVMSHLTVDIKKDLIDKYLGAMELNKIYGASFRSERKAMIKDILGKYAPSILSKLFIKREDGCPFHKEGKDKILLNSIKITK